MSESTVSTRLNDVDLDAVGDLAAAIVDDADKAATTWSASVQWTGGFRSESTIREFAPTPSDEPVGLGGTDRAANPVEQLLGALGNCLAVGYAANASVAGVELRDLRVEVDGDLDLHSFLGLRDGHAGFESIRARVFLDTDADAAAVRELHAKVSATSPVGHTLAQPVPLSIELA